MQITQLQEEQLFTARVQQLLSAAIEKAKGFADGNMESIRLMLVDAWEELRLKPTALSPKDLEQISQEVHHYLARYDRNKQNEKQFTQMLLNPFFARVDFREAGAEEIEKIVIGLYSLTDPATGKNVVYDWRAPVCALYYDSMPGEVSYTCPDGIMRGQMLLKRQYKMENGRLAYYIDTEMSIEDELLLDILSGATDNHMRQIVSTIQKEQSVAVRYDNVKLLCVVGAAGSGKTSVAMHRAAYLMYRHRDSLDSKRIIILSPSNAFGEYISTVLPELGEENTRSRTLHEIMTSLLGAQVELPVRQLGRLTDAEYTLRRESVQYKSGAAFLKKIRAYCAHYRTHGPDFEDVIIEGQVLAEAKQLKYMYTKEFSILSPALRMLRIQTVLNQRLETWTSALEKQYENSMIGRFKGKQLATAARMAAMQRLYPARALIKRMTETDPLRLFANMMQDAPEALREAAEENAQARCVWWEDAAAIACIMLELGFTQPDKNIRHLIVDEAQDYSHAALRALSLYYPNAKVTLLGDPRQRTCPGMEACRPEEWASCFGLKEAPVLTLGKCYRSTLPITRFLNSLLPETEAIIPFGREGDKPAVLEYDESAVVEAVKQMRTEYRRVAVVTRTAKQADSLSRKIEGAYLLDGDDDSLYESDDIAVACYHMLKGMEFDAVAVVWPDIEIDDGERRRLYTACSRALHKLMFFADKATIDRLEIEQ